MRTAAPLPIPLASLGCGLLATICLAAGCAGPGAPDVTRENIRLKEQLADRDRQLAAQVATIGGLNEQLRVARAIKPEDLQRIFYPDTIEIETLSGGYDDDGKPGDDGVVVYIRPIDRDGDVVKVVGDIRVELFDLDAPGDKVVGVTYVAAADAAKHWYGKFNTNHYTVKCPWSAGPPAHAELTIRVTFADYLTQRVITQQTVRRVAIRQ